MAYSKVVQYTLSTGWEGVSDILSDATSDQVLVQNQSGYACMIDYTDSDNSGFILTPLTGESPTAVLDLSLNPVVRSVSSSKVVFIYDNVRYYLYFDGNSYLQFAPVTLSVGDTISFYMLIPDGFTPSSDNAGFIDGDLSGDRLYLFQRSNNTWAMSGASAKIDGVDVSNNGAVTQNDGKVHLVELTCTSEGSRVGYAGCRYGGANGYATCYMWDININNQHLYKLDKNVYPGLAFEDSIGDNDAQGYNFQESSFVRSLPSA